LCVLHGDVPPSSQRSTGKGVAGDHPIALCNIRGTPRECHAPCSRSEYKILWWTCWSWVREVEDSHIVNYDDNDDDDDDDDSFIHHTACCTHAKVKQEVQEIYKALPIEQSNDK